MSDDKIATLIRKLLKLAANNPSAEEAAAAFGRAQELAAKYRLDLDDVGVEEEAEPAPREVEKIVQQTIEHWNRAVPWKLTIAQAVARANDCRTFYVSGTHGGITAYGQERDLQIVSYLYKAISREVDRLARLANVAGGRSWGRNFRMGAADEIATRLARAQRKVLAEAKEEAFARGGETALVRIDRAEEYSERVSKAVDDYADSELNLGRGVSFRDASGYGYRDGRRAGSSVAISGGGRALRSGATALKGGA